jgi:tRNA-2-methylthio-N6-dimethylallyladenosine synthase
VLVAEGEGRKDGATARLSGRAADNRLVHFAVPAGAAPDELPRPGDLVRVDVTHAAPHFLVADGATGGGSFVVRRTRAGDAWAARGRDEHMHGHGGAAAGPVSLGIPAVGAPTR